MRRRKLQPKQLPPCVPDEIQHDGVTWEPTWEERALVWNRQQMALALAEVNRIELEEQAVWLAAQTKRLAAIALELDEAERKSRLHDEMDRQEAWFRQCQDEAKATETAIMAHFQKQMDGGAYEKMVERANKAKADMDRDNARLERLALLKRGVLRGQRKKFAVMPTYGVDFR
jgi:hypothetical protein